MSSRRRNAATIAIDIAVVAVVVLVEIGPVVGNAPPWGLRPLTGLDVVRFVGFCAPLLFRRSHPVAALGVMIASFVGSDMLGFGLVAAFYSVGAWGLREWPSRIAAVSGAVIVTAALVVYRNVGVPFEAVIPLATFIGAAVFGETMRLRRSYTAVLEERARALEAERDEGERRAAGRERARIARDLHDIVAHRVSMMTVQAGAARVVAEKDPDAARRAIALLEHEGRTTLWELRRLLDVLRDDDPANDLSPRPNLRELERLAAAVQSAGTTVRLTLLGEVSEVPEAMQVSAYRIVQEAITNVIKHAGSGAEADVVVRCLPHMVEIDVTDSGTGVTASRLPGGHGIVGMRERAAVFGGTVIAEPRDVGGFRVHATLPIPTPR